jgi:tetratricopeptide (TPR) repeat protein
MAKNRRKKAMETQALQKQPNSAGPGRKALFTAIAVLLPIIAVVAVESVLSAKDAFPRQPLFIRNTQFPEYSLANPTVVQRFFSRPEMAPNVSIETAFFRTEKAPGTLRLVVQGGSSAAGFPFGYGASLAGMLEQRLRREFPERPVEVISTAMSAVNSYTLLDFVDEIIALQPDAVLVYAGHNEYLGILGVGSALSSSQSPALTRLIMDLRRFRLYRGLERMLAPRRHGGGGEVSGADDGTLMARIAAERRIPYGSELFRRGEQQFGRNLGDILDRYAGAGIPVLVATLVSNESDQPPFIDGLAVSPGPVTDPSAYDPETTDPARTDDLALELAARAEAGSAVSAYRLGRLRLATGDFAGARRAFQHARDLDQLRFRAPESFNDIIRAAAADHEAHLVDVEEAFRRASPNGIIGGELIAEHLHPTVGGYFVLTDAFHRALLDQGLLPDEDSVVPATVARAEIPVSAVDANFGKYKLIRLMSHWPFTEVLTEPVLPAAVTLEEQLARQLFDQQIDWTAAHRRLQSGYADGRNPPEYLRVSLILADAFPFSAPDNLVAGRALDQTGRHLQAVRYLLQADRYRRDHVPTLMALARACKASGLRDLGRGTVERVLGLDPDNREARGLLGELDRT